MVDDLVEIPEGQEAGSVSQAAYLVHILLHLLVDTCQMVEEMAEAPKAHRDEMRWSITKGW